MFDYQAGEKYKLTLIMVGMAGLMAGMFFSLLLMPADDGGAAKHHRKLSERDMRIMNDPDVNGGRSMQQAGSGDAYAAQQGQGQSADAQQAPPLPAQIVDRFQAKNFIDGWLPLAWDLSAGSAKNSQEQAIAYMTSDCAQAYRQNIWSPEMAKQIDDAGLKSTFQPQRVEISNNMRDGSVIVYVTGVQNIGVPGGPGKSRQVNLEYIVKATTDGLRVAGISEKGQGR